MLPCVQDQANPGPLVDFEWQVRGNLGCWLQEDLQHIKRLQKENNRIAENIVHQISLTITK